MDSQPCNNFFWRHTETVDRWSKRSDYVEKKCLSALKQYRTAVHQHRPEAFYDVPTYNKQMCKTALI